MRLNTSVSADTEAVGNNGGKPGVTLLVSNSLGKRMLIVAGNFFFLFSVQEIDIEERNEAMMLY